MILILETKIEYVNHQNKLQYYGLDIGGFYQNWLNPMNQIFRYLLDLVVDTEYAKKLVKNEL